MAAWIKPLLWACLAALLLHVLGLIGIGSQLQNISALTPIKDPLFTRTIEAASPQADPLPAAPPPPAPPPAPQLVESNSALITESVAVPTELAEPTPTTPVFDSTPTMVEITTLTAALETSTVVIETSSQTLSANPAGQTDSLLVTGEWPGDTRVTYVAGGYYQGRELTGSGQVQWTRSGELNQNYQVRVDLRVYGLANVSMTSQGKVSPQGLQPQVYEEVVDPIVGKQRVRVLRFEQEELVSEGERRFRRPAQDPLGVQDTVSQFIELGHRFLMGRAKLEDGSSISVWLGRPGGLDEWTFDIGPVEQVTLPKIGPVKAHHLKPRPLLNPRGPIYVQMWFAPSLQYLPVKIRIDLNAQTHVELMAERLEQR